MRGILGPARADCRCRGEHETRDALVGVSDRGQLLFVVHIEREQEAIRIISARSATAIERRTYEDYA